MPLIYEHQTQYETLLQSVFQMLLTVAQGQLSCALPAELRIR